MQQNEPKKFVKKVLPLGSPERRFLEDLIIDYYMGYFAEIKRSWKPKDIWEMQRIPIIGLELFVNGLYKSVTRRLAPNQKEFIKQAIDILEENLSQWHKEFEEDPEFKKAIGKSYVWIKDLKDQYKYAPSNYWELKWAFWGVEAFLMIGDKKII